MNNCEHFKVDVFLKDGSVQRVESTFSRDFEHLCQKVAANRFILFAKSGVSFQTSEIVKLEYAYKVR